MKGASLADLKPDDPRIVTIRVFAGGETEADDIRHQLIDVTRTLGYDSFGVGIDLPSEWEIRQAQENGWLDDEAE